MGKNRRRRGLSLLFAALGACGLAAADDFSQFHFHKSADAPAGGTVPGAAVATPNPACDAQHLQVGGQLDLHISQGPSGARFCTDMATCKAYCCWACDFHDERVTRDNKGNRTSRYDASSSCQRSPQDGSGIIAPNDRQLVDLGTALHDTKVLNGYNGKYATQTAADALQRLDAFLDTWPKR